MYWSHGFDFLIRVIGFGASVFAASPLFPLLDQPIFEGVQLWLKVTVLLLFMALFYIVLHLSILGRISSWLYCRFHLKMPVSLSQAHQLQKGLSPLFPHRGTWLTFAEVKDLEPDEKFSRALELQKQWLEDLKAKNSGMITRFNQSSFKTQFIAVTLVVYMILMLVFSYMNLPPASYIAYAIANMLNVDTYYPMLNWIILTIPVILLAKLIDKDLGKIGF